MSTRPLMDRLEALRAAGAELRKRPALETLEALAAFFEGWSDETSTWRRDLAAELPAVTGFSPEVVSEGLRVGLGSWNGASFRALVADELGPDESLDGGGAELVSGFDLTATFLAGSIPMPTLLAFAAPLALRSPVVAKTAARDPLTACHIARSIADCDELLGRCVAAVEFAHDDAAKSDALLTADCVIATGSDATVAAISERARPLCRFVRYGHRLSVAAVGPDALHRSARADAARRLATDVALWDQLGCLSPVVVYAVGSDASSVDAFAEELAGALQEIEERLPRGVVGKAAAAQISQERAEAEMRAAAGARVAVHAGARWTVIREDKARLRPAPLHRFVRVLPTRDSDELLSALAPLRPHLAAVGLEGFGGDLRSVAKALAALGASRSCPLGEMQSPPVAWRHDNRPVLIPLARFADLEFPI